MREKRTGDGEIFCLVENKGLDLDLRALRDAHKHTATHTHRMRPAESL